MDQVILDHSYFDEKLTWRKRPADDSLLSEGLISLFGSFPNFIKKEDAIISNRSIYYKPLSPFVINDGIEINGKREGYLVSYYYGNIISSIGRYKNDQRDGLWKHYDGHGNLVREEFYRNRKMWILKDEEDKLIY